jgi:hypothetical protein
MPAKEQSTGICNSADLHLTYSAIITLLPALGNAKTLAVIVKRHSAEDI